ncbi:MAG: pilin [Candidatus Yonathbacteria bacterium]|nr:pilin [Candidatus Yonathbacteria bacterium]
MKKTKPQIIFIAVSALFLFILSGVSAYAALLEPSIGGGVNVDANPGEYFNKIYRLMVGVAGVLAVIMIVIGGLEYIASAANPSAKASAKNRIWAAIGGLLLALSSYLILQTINPDLVNFNLNIIKSDNLYQKTGGSTGGGAPGGGSINAGTVPAEDAGGELNPN